MHKPASKKRVIILGIDAMDPNITEELMKEGRLPNFSYLMRTGSYAHLATTMPSESIVAWSSFSTGLNPGGHDIFDFIMRDPANYIPYLALNEISNYRGRTEIKIRRKGEAFWNILSRNKIPCFIYFCPNTFPPEAVCGRMLSGMGVPDITGTMGKFSFYTTKMLSDEDKDSRGRIIQVAADKDIIQTGLYGPKVFSHGSIAESKAPLKIRLKPNEGGIEIYLQKEHFFLKRDGWSDWQRVSFKIGPFRKAHGIVRFYLKSIEPDFELYATPINFDPQRPLFPISYPKDYSGKLAEKTGLYYTQGMPHDTWALTENRVDEKVFLEHADEIISERERILNAELKEFKGGLFFFYFDTLDTIQHMFWRYLDPRHPLYERDSLYRDTVFKYYEKIDRIIGNVLKGNDKDTTLIILSDHGFSSFRRAVDLNRWLLENRYLYLKEKATEGRELFGDVDWSRTKAYALGFGGIYLNKAGREYCGIVNESEVSQLKGEIIKGLKELRDPKTGETAVKNIYTGGEIFRGPYANDGPDLFVGFNAGFRASWQTALGGMAPVLIEDNPKKWSGDHLIDSSLVPGVIFINKKIDFRSPSITGIASSILGLFDIPKPDEMSEGLLDYNP